MRTSVNNKRTNFHLVGVPSSKGTEILDYQRHLPLRITIVIETLKRGAIIFFKKFLQNCKQSFVLNSINFFIIFKNMYASFIENM